MIKDFNFYKFYKLLIIHIKRVLIVVEINIIIIFILIDVFKFRNILLNFEIINIFEILLLVTYKVFDHKNLINNNLLRLSRLKT